MRSPPLTPLPARRSHVTGVCRLGALVPFYRVKAGGDTCRATPPPHSAGLSSLYVCSIRTDVTFRRARSFRGRCWNCCVSQKWFKTDKLLLETLNTPVLCLSLISCALCHSQQTTGSMSLSLMAEGMLTACTGCK